MVPLEEISSLVLTLSQQIERSGKWVMYIPPKNLPFITLEEMQFAEIEILRNVWDHHFAEDLKVLSSSEKVPHVNFKKCSSLRSLDPILIDGLWQIGRRLSLASTLFESKHQIILPKNDHVMDLIFDSYHKISGHAGREHVLSLVREKFWIIQASSVIR